MDSHNVYVLNLGKVHTVRTNFCVCWQFRIVQVNNLYGVASVDGFFIIPPKYYQLSYWPQKRLFLAQKTSDYNSWGAFHLDGTVYIDFVFEHHLLLKLL